MQKITKGALASGAAALLLIGGGSTLALWSDSEAINGGTITTGTVDVEAVSSNADFNVQDLAPGVSVPVDHVYTVKLEGVENATLEVEAPTIPAGTDGVVFESIATFEGGQSVDLADGGKFDITAGGELTVTTTVSVDEGVTDLDLRDQTVTITPGKVTVTQVTGAPETP